MGLEVRVRIELQSPSQRLAEVPPGLFPRVGPARAPAQPAGAQPAAPPTGTWAPSGAGRQVEPALHFRGDFVLGLEVLSTSLSVLTPHRRWDCAAGQPAPPHKAAQGRAQPSRPSFSAAHAFLSCSFPAGLQGPLCPSLPPGRPPGANKHRTTVTQGLSGPIASAPLSPRWVARPETPTNHYKTPRKQGASASPGNRAKVTQIGHCYQNAPGHTLQPPPCGQQTSAH